MNRAIAFATVGTPTYSAPPWLQLLLRYTNCLFWGVSKRPFPPTTPAATSDSHYASHAYHSCQLTNGRAGWPAEIQIKEDSAKHISEAAPHVHLLPPHRGSPPAGCPEDRYSLRGRIWQHALGRRYGVKTCASPAGTRMECAEGSLNWSIFSASTVLIFVS
jgi:hypothetical protein